MRYKWAQQTEKIEEVIKATHDPLKEWCQDPHGYFLIRVVNEQIEVGFVTNDHIISKKIVGTDATTLYNTIIRHKLLTRLEHAAYLGKELYKAELAVKHGKTYTQEAALDLS
jgi:tetrahydromethanopterin S-methyltransferase subunit A